MLRFCGEDIAIVPGFTSGTIEPSSNRKDGMVH
jgi:hypothetical protein